ARVPNARADHPDPPTCQHALRQARQLAKNIAGPPSPYGYRMLGQVATLGRYKGIADVLGLRLRLPRLVRDADVSPLPAPARAAKAARRRGLDGGTALPARRGRAVRALTET